MKLDNGLDIAPRLDQTWTLDCFFTAFIIFDTFCYLCFSVLKKLKYLLLDGNFALFKTFASNFTLANQILP